MIDRPSRDGISSTALKALHVLEVVAAEPRPLSLREVAARAGMDRSATHRMLATLLAAGYVRQEASTRRYAMSYRVVSLSRNLLADNEVVGWPVETLEQIAVRDAGRASTSRSSTARRPSSSSTSRERSSWPSTSRSVIAVSSTARRSARRSLPSRMQDFIEAVIAAGLPGLTASTITDPDALRRELRHRTRARLRHRRPRDGRRHALHLVPVFERDGPCAWASAARGR